MDTILTSHILIFQNNQVLLVKHGEKAGHLTGVYGIPGGHVEEGESLERAAVREFAEETGLIVHKEDLQEFPHNEYTADIQRKDGTTKRFTMHIFVAHMREGTLRENGETSPEWVSLDTLGTYPLLPNVKNAILAAQEFIAMQHKPLISIVASMTDERVIGKNNMIPWHITKDLVRFKNKCLGRVVIMGRKTFDSLVSYYDKSGRPLPGKTYVIVTTDTAYRPTRENTVVVLSFEEALQKAKELEKEEIIIAGGSSIYTQALPFADKLYLTLVHMPVDGDAFFPEYSMFAKVTQEETFTTDTYSYTFLTLEK